MTTSGATARRFAQVDVFAGPAYTGNPLAVVLDAEGLSDDLMQRFARWTNLSETTFLLPPTESGADYRVRIFTPSGELPFAGHPTLGSCHAWASSRPGPVPDRIVQECAAGLVEVSRTDAGYAFAAPPLLRSGPVDERLHDELASALSLAPEAIRDAQWVDNGPGWVAVLLDSAKSVLDVPLPSGTHKIGVVGPHPPGAPYDFEVRAFFPAPSGVIEDPVTGSLNAGIAQWLTGTGRAPEHYTAHQGTAVGADGRVVIDRDPDGIIWVGGAAVTRIQGEVRL
ncbi:PhzF family phenazine biosynthesis protein [Saccharopolyspora elongata]|uniref:PhzF family phenazine biosynthesis protein n=1 Tax=Saccharopolyspora elongata TaxID=2530387 RepID=A0A4R4Z6E8_9PSEU|nr:PhzF family phenazine biosynthesis protein [Saccharopolyspora elongata]TDD53120.1 PhzF family phenazine biosynthesis protein [Saccharopolyspora elongata]